MCCQVNNSAAQIKICKYVVQDRLFPCKCAAVAAQQLENISDGSSGATLGGTGDIIRLFREHLGSFIIIITPVRRLGGGSFVLTHAEIF